MEPEIGFLKWEALGAFSAPPERRALRQRALLFFLWPHCINVRSEGQASGSALSQPKISHGGALGGPGSRCASGPEDFPRRPPWSPAVRPFQITIVQT